MKDTIFALSTLPGKSGVAVIRISGHLSAKVVSDISSISEFKPRRATFANLYDPRDGEFIDQAIIIYFKNPNSFTGEDVMEIQFHGSIAVIDHLIDVLTNLKYLRIAEPGEFSKRAFLNEKLDLTQAEALADLIDAETRLQKKVALRQLGGELRQLYEGWRKRIVQILSQVEALIDFPEDDIPENTLIEINNSVDILYDQMTRHVQASISGEIINRGLHITIAGSPNVGKSSLLNSLAKNDLAIVSDIAGTTRDVITVKIDLLGYPVIVSDTAGIRETTDAIEQEGVRRSIQKLDEADITIIMLDASKDYISDLCANLKNYKDESKLTIVLVNKYDLADNVDNDSIKKIIPNSSVIALSVKTGYAMQDFVDELSRLIRERYCISDEPLITHHRYRMSINACLENFKLFKSSSTIEISAEYLRQSACDIGKITGIIDVEEILDNIFSSFCIGK